MGTRAESGAGNGKPGARRYQTLGKSVCQWEDTMRTRKKVGEACELCVKKSRYCLYCTWYRKLTQVDEERIRFRMGRSIVMNSAKMTP